jgi:hypothetical protein
MAFSLRRSNLRIDIILIFLIVSFLLLCDKSEEFLRVTIRKYALSLKRKVLWRKKARRPPEGYLKYPLEASHWQLQGGPLHGLLQTEAILF